MVRINNDLKNFPQVRNYKITSFLARLKMCANLFLAHVFCYDKNEF
jgi:hypothetical protein